MKALPSRTPSKPGGNLSPSTLSVANVRSTKGTTTSVPRRRVGREPNALRLRQPRQPRATLPAILNELVVESDVSLGDGVGSMQLRPAAPSSTSRSISSPPRAPAPIPAASSAGSDLGITTAAPSPSARNPPTVVTTTGEPQRPRFGERDRSNVELRRDDEHGRPDHPVRQLGRGKPTLHGDRAPVRSSDLGLPAVCRPAGHEQVCFGDGLSNERPGGSQQRPALDRPRAACEQDETRLRRCAPARRSARR